jgi:hypothetical protein
MKRYLTVGLLIAIFIALPATAQKKNDCIGKDANLACLKRNYESLLSKNYVLFWEILHDAAKKAKKCTPLHDTTDFFELESYIGGNAELQEFFSEINEDIFVAKSDCYMKALVSLDEDSMYSLIDRLRHPLFTKEYKIKEVFLRYTDHKQFKVVSEIYFSDK